MNECLCGRSPDPGIKPGGGCRCADDTCKHCEGTGALTDGVTDCPRCKVHPAGWGCPHDAPLVWVYSDCRMDRMLVCPQCRKEFRVDNADLTEVCATGDHAACMLPGCECGCHAQTITVEVCGSCGQPANPNGSYWFAPNDLWNEVYGSSNGFSCIPCFTADCRGLGIHVAWTTTEEWSER